MGHISIFALFAFLKLWAFWAILTLGYFRCFSCDLGVFRVIVSYEVMKGIILVAGRVTEVFWVGFGGFKGILGGSGGLHKVSSQSLFQDEVALGTLGRQSYKKNGYFSQVADLTKNLVRYFIIPCWETGHDH